MSSKLNMKSAVDMDVRDITICPICGNTYEDPKMLPCLHNFCRKCLETPDTDQHGTKVPSTGVQGTGEQSTVEPSTDGRAQCKICQTEYVVPAGGFSSLPSNAFVKQLTVLVNLLRPASPGQCETCPASRNSVSQVYCIDCDQAMCDECKESHLRARFSQNHKSLVFGSQLEPEVMKDRNIYCELHPRNLLTMYCRDDKKTICFECAAVDHRSHNCTPLSKVTESVVSRLNDDLSRLEIRLAECKTATGKLDEIQNSLKQEANKMEASIDKAVSECIALINKAGDTLREKLSNWKGKSLLDIEVKKREVQRFVKRIDVYRRLADELLQKGSPADFSNAMDLMKARAHELDSLPTDCEGNDLIITRTAFCPTNLASLLDASEIKSAVGDLHFIPASQRHIKFSRNAQGPTSAVQPLTTAADLEANGSQVPTVEVDGIRSLEDASAVASLLQTSTIGRDQIQWKNFDEINQALQVRFCDKIRYQLKSMTLEGQDLTLHWRHDIKPFQAQLLMLSNFEGELKNAGLQCDVRITSDGIFLRGSEESMVTAKIKVLDKINEIIGISPSTATEVQRKLMRRDAVQEYVHGICQQRDIKATLASDPTLQICAFDEQENVKLENLLTSIIKELEFSLDVSNSSAASLSDELKKRQEELEFIIDPVQKKIRIACLDKDEGQIREFVEQFIREISMVEKRVSISKRVKDYIWQHKTEEFSVLKENLQKHGGSLVYNEGAVTFKGNCTSVDSAEAQLRKIAESLVEKSYTVDHPAGESYLTKTTPGKLILKGIESEDKALITVSSTAPSMDREPAATPDFDSSSSCTILMRLTNNEGAIVTVVSGKIESQRVDVIVNSVDRNLRLDSGEISNSILLAAGSSIQEECKKKVSAVEFGKLVRTDGHNLPCKHVYHVAAMQWDGGKGRSKTILAEVVKNCLIQAHADRLKSIAFPAIGAGTLAFPEDVVVKTLFEEVETFSRAHPVTSLKDIRFVICTEALRSQLDALISHGGSWRKVVPQPLKPNPIKTSLTILASSEKVADDVCKKIEDILKEHTTVDSIDSAKDREAIGFLTNQKVSCSSK